MSLSYREHFMSVIPSLTLFAQNREPLAGFSIAYDRPFSRKGTER